MADVLIYGASGYTGRLAAEHAVERGLRPVLAGRSAEKVRALAERLGLPWRSFSLGSRDEIAAGIAGAGAVLHAAGPFSATALPMAKACMDVGAHYVDVTGEIDVFEALASLDVQANAAGVMLLPGAGFDVVPSDCLAAHVASRLERPARLRLSIGGFGGFSRGTAKTMVEAVGLGVRVRRNRILTELDSTPEAAADFGDGPRATVGVSWGDVSTAWRSTRIPEIEVFFEASPMIRRASATPKLVRKVLAAGFMQTMLKRLIETRLPEGPTPEQRAKGRSLFLAEAWDEQGGYAASRLRTQEAYALTAQTAVEILRRAAAGDAVPGYQTPSKAYGANFILGFSGVERVDL